MSSLKITPKDGIEKKSKEEERHNIQILLMSETRSLNIILFIYRLLVT